MEKKNTKLSLKVSEITKENILSLSHLPINLACLALQINVEALQQRCRELGYKRWPYNARKEIKMIKCNKKVVKKDKMGYFHEFSMKEEKEKKEEKGYLTLDFSKKKKEVQNLKPNKETVNVLPSFSEFIKDI